MIRVSIVVGGPWAEGGLVWEIWKGNNHHYSELCASQRPLGRNGRLDFYSSYGSPERWLKPSELWDHLRAPENWDGTLPETDGTVEFYVKSSEPHRGGKVVVMRSFDVEVWMQAYPTKDENGLEEGEREETRLVPDTGQPRPSFKGKAAPSVAYLTRQFRDKIDAAVQQAEKEGYEIADADALVRFVIVPFAQT